MTPNFELYKDINNPLDHIEDVMASHDWSFERPNADELMVQITGKHTDYNMTFLWQEEYSAMQFFCEFNIEIPQKRYDMTCGVIRTINESLWLGHFDVPKESRMPCLRHTTLFRGMNHTSGNDYIADLIEIALAECEKYHSAFNMLAYTPYLDEDLLALALSETSGEA